MSKITLEWFNDRRRHEQRIVQVITDDAVMRVSVPCEQGTSGIRTAYKQMPLPKGTVLLSGTHNAYAYEWEWYEFEYFLADPDNEQEGILGYVQQKNLQKIEVVQ